MKQYFKPLLITMITIVLASCSQDNSIEDLSAETPLKSYKLSRAEDGSYTLNQSLSDGYSSSIISNNGVNEIILGESNGSSDSNSTVLPLINNELKIDFVSETSYNIPGITIFDDEPSAKGNTASKKASSYLKSYEITQLNNSEFELGFKIANNVVASFSYNEEYERHEVRLEPGDNQGKKKYSKKYTKFDGEKLTIVFIHVKVISSLSSRGVFDVVGPPVITFD